MIGYQKILGFQNDEMKPVHTEMFLAVKVCLLILALLIFVVLSY